MPEIVLQLLIGVLLIIFTALFTYYMTTRGQKKTLTDIITEAFINHRAIYHKKDLSEVLKEHKNEIRKDVDKRLDKMDDLISKLFTSLNAIRTSQAFIVGKLGGNAKEYGLREESNDST